MNIQELIERYESYEGIWDAPGAEAARKCFLRDLKQLEELPSGHVEEAPRYVKNVLARLRELPLHDREVWLKAIMSEFEQDFSHAIWREGYEQGKFEGMIEREKVKIPQFVADWIKVAKPVYSLSGAIVYGSPGVNKWLESWDNQDLFARAWLDGYEVEKEKRYLVKIKGIDPDFDILKYNLGARNWFTGSRHKYSSFRLHHTRKELEDAGFGWVFDCPGIQIEEVENE